MWPAIVEGEAVVLDRPAPAADAVVLLEQQRVLAEMIGGAQPGGAGADDDDRRAVLMPRRHASRPLRRRGSSANPATAGPARHATGAGTVDGRAPAVFHGAR